VLPRILTSLCLECGRGRAPHSSRFSSSRLQPIPAPGRPARHIHDESLGGKIDRLLDELLARACEVGCDLRPGQRAQHPPQQLGVRGERGVAGEHHLVLQPGGGRRGRGLLAATGRSDRPAEREQAGPHQAEAEAKGAGPRHGRQCAIAIAAAPPGEKAEPKKPRSGRGVGRLLVCGGVSFSLLSGRCARYPTSNQATFRIRAFLFRRSLGVPFSASAVDEIWMSNTHASAGRRMQPASFDTRETVQL
jgi:hypothetical protein